MTLLTHAVTSTSFISRNGQRSSSSYPPVFVVSQLKKTKVNSGRRTVPVLAMICFCGPEQNHSPSLKPSGVFAVVSGQKLMEVSVDTHSHSKPPTSISSAPPSPVPACPEWSSGIFRINVVQPLIMHKQTLVKC